MGVISESNAHFQAILEIRVFYTLLIDSINWGILLFLQLPHCTDDEAISVACLDLHYHVTVHMNIRHIKPEKKGRVSSFIDVPEEGDNEDVTDRTDVEGGFDH